jgi:hypothetical protein
VEHPVTRDPRVHAEKTITPGFGHAAIGALLLTATGLGGPPPKTVATGCGKRRPFTRTATVPGDVTCVACRAWARRECLQAAELTESLLTLWDEAPTRAAAAVTGITRDDLRRIAGEHRAHAAQYH